MNQVQRRAELDIEQLLNGGYKSQNKQNLSKLSSDMKKFTEKNQRRSESLSTSLLYGKRAHKSNQNPQVATKLIFDGIKVDLEEKSVDPSRKYKFLDNVLDQKEKLKQTLEERSKKISLEKLAEAQAAHKAQILQKTQNSLRNSKNDGSSQHRKLKKNETRIESRIQEPVTPSNETIGDNESKSKLGDKSNPKNSPINSKNSKQPKFVAQANKHQTQGRGRSQNIREIQKKDNQPKSPLNSKHSSKNIARNSASSKTSKEGIHSPDKKKTEGIRSLKHPQNTLQSFLNSSLDFKHKKLQPDLINPKMFSQSLESSPIFENSAQKTSNLSFYQKNLPKYRENTSITENHKQGGENPARVQYGANGIAGRILKILNPKASKVKQEERKDEKPPKKFFPAGEKNHDGAMLTEQINQSSKTNTQNEQKASQQINSHQHQKELIQTAFHEKQNEWKKKQAKILTEWREGKNSQTLKGGALEFTVKIGDDILKSSNVKIGFHGELYEEKIAQNLHMKFSQEVQEKQRQPEQVQKDSIDLSPILKESLSYNYNQLYNDESDGQFRTSASKNSTGNNYFLGQVNDSREQTPIRIGFQKSSSDAKKMNEKPQTVKGEVTEPGSKQAQSQHHSEEKSLNFSPFEAENKLTARIGGGLSYEQIDKKEDDYQPQGGTSRSKTETKTDNSLSFKCIDIHRRQFILSDSESIPRRYDISPPIRIDGKIDKSQRRSFDNGSSKNVNTIESSVQSNVSVNRKNLFFIGNQNQSWSSKNYQAASRTSFLSPESYANNQSQSQLVQQPGPFQNQLGSRTTHNLVQVTSSKQIKLDYSQSQYSSIGPNQQSLPDVANALSQEKCQYGYSSMVNLNHPTQFLTAQVTFQNESQIQQNGQRNIPNSSSLFGDLELQQEKGFSTFSPAKPIHLSPRDLKVEVEDVKFSNSKRVLQEQLKESYRFDSSRQLGVLQNLEPNQSTKPIVPVPTLVKINSETAHQLKHNFAETFPNMKARYSDSSTKENQETANFGGKLKHLLDDTEVKIADTHPKIDSPNLGLFPQSKEPKNFNSVSKHGVSTLSKQSILNQSLVNETLNLMTRSQYVQNSIKPQRRSRQSQDIHDQNSLKKKYDDIMHEIKNGVKTGKELKFDLLDNTSVHFSDFKDYEGEQDPSKLKRIIRDLEIENREKDAEIIKLGMQVKDLSRLITNYIRCQKYGVTSKLNFDVSSSGLKPETPK